MGLVAVFAINWFKSKIETKSKAGNSYFITAPTQFPEYLLLLKKTNISKFMERANENLFRSRSRF